jgi:hypothetical protein
MARFTKPKPRSPFESVDDGGQPPEPILFYTGKDFEMMGVHLHMEMLALRLIY